MMMKRTKEIKIRLSEHELDELNKAVVLSGLSREEYIRTLLKKIVPTNKPTPELIETIKQLRLIGNNINQIAMIANKTGSIDTVRYKYDNEKLQREILKILMKINTSESLKED